MLQRGQPGEESDSDYDEEMDDQVQSDDDFLDDYFLSDTQRYGEPPKTIFSEDLMITGTNVLRWLPLDAIRQKKATTKKHHKLSSKSMIKGVTDRAVLYAKNNIVKNFVSENP